MDGSDDLESCLKSHSFCSQQMNFVTRVDKILECLLQGLEIITFCIWKLFLVSPLKASGLHIVQVTCGVSYSVELTFSLSVSTKALC